MLAGLVSVLVLAVGVATPAETDPADGPPPLLEDIAPPDAGDAPAAAVEEAPAPRPIEEPEDGAPDAAPPPEQVDEGAEGAEERDGAKAARANDDWLMLGVDYLVIFVPVVGGPLFAPLAQGLLHKYAGGVIAQNDYPNWWMGTLAGYGMFALSGAMLVGGYLLAVVGSLALIGSSPSAAIGAGFGGLALMLAGVAVVFVEPLVVYAIAGIGALPNAEARAQGVRFGEPDEDDGTPEHAIGWIGAR